MMMFMIAGGVSALILQTLTVGNFQDTPHAFQLAVYFGVEYQLKVGRHGGYVGEREDRPNSLSVSNKSV